MKTKQNKKQVSVNEFYSEYKNKLNWFAWNKLFPRWFLLFIYLLIKWSLIVYIYFSVYCIHYNLLYFLKRTYPYVCYIVYDSFDFLLHVSSYYLLTVYILYVYASLFCIHLYWLSYCLLNVSLVCFYDSIHRYFAFSWSLSIGLVIHLNIYMCLL